jgi:hypothetical protein
MQLYSLSCEPVDGIYAFRDLYLWEYLPVVPAKRLELEK